jgi:hypothetical protein
MSWTGGFHMKWWCSPITEGVGSAASNDTSAKAAHGRRLLLAPVQDLGGVEAVSAAKRALLDASVCSLIVLQSLDA